METFPHLPPSAHGWSRKQYLWAAGSLLLCVSPILTILLEWGLATLALGSKPIRSITGPSEISPVLTAIHYISTALVYTPFITTFLLPYLWWKHAERNHQTQLIAWGCVILPIACIYILRTDPTGIAKWWLS